MTASDWTNEREKHREKEGGSEGGEARGGGGDVNDRFQNCDNPILNGVNNGDWEYDSDRESDCDNTVRMTESERVLDDTETDGDTDRETTAGRQMQTMLPSRGVRCVSSLPKYETAIRNSVYRLLCVCVVWVWVRCICEVMVLKATQQFIHSNDRQTTDRTTWCISFSWIDFVLLSFILKLHFSKFQNVL